MEGLTMVFACGLLTVRIGTGLIQLWNNMAWEGGAVKADP
jgi:hypothetical protein